MVRVRAVHSNRSDEPRVGVGRHDEVPVLPAVRRLERGQAGVFGDHVVGVVRVDQRVAAVAAEHLHRLDQDLVAVVVRDCHRSRKDLVAAVVLQAAIDDVPVSAARRGVVLQDVQVGVQVGPVAGDVVSERARIDAAVIADVELAVRDDRRVLVRVRLVVIAGALER